MKRILSLLLGLILMVPQTIYADNAAPKITVSEALYIIAESRAKALWGLSLDIADWMIAKGEELQVLSRQGAYASLKAVQKGVNNAVYSVENPSGPSNAPRTVLAVAIAAGMAYGTYRFILKPACHKLFNSDDTH